MDSRLRGNDSGIACGDVCLNRFLDRLEMTIERWNGIWGRKWSAEE